MTVDLNDPASLAAWREVYPQRHDALLRIWWRTYPQFRAAIEASRGIAA